MKIVELVEQARKSGLDKEPRFMSLLSSYIATRSEDRLRQLTRMMAPYLVEQEFNPNPYRPYPSPEEVFGLIPIGKIPETSTIVGVFPEEMMRGTLIVGGYGTGKTNLCYLIAECGSHLGIKFLILDVKQDYRHIIKRLSNVLIFRPSHQENTSALIYNPLYTADELVSWAQIFSDITAEAHNVYDGTSNYLLKHVDVLYKKYQTETTARFPTIAELHDAISRDNHPLITRDARYRESALNRLGLIKHTLGAAVEYRKGYDMNKLLENNNVVVELDSLGHASRVYLSTLILAQLFHSRIRTKNNSPVIVIIDEANDIFNRELERKRGSLMIAQLARQAREFNLGIVASCQVPLALNDTVLNAYITILFNLPEGRNLEYMARSMQLTEEQKLTNPGLRTGMATVRNARFSRPLPIFTPLYPLSKDVSDDDVERHMNQFIDDLHKDIDKGSGEVTVIEADEDQMLASGVTNTEGQEAKDISAVERNLLMEVFLRVYETVTQHFRSLSLSAGKGTRLVKSLLSKNLIKVHKINLGGRGGTAKFLELTDKGHEVLGVQLKNKIGKGAGFEHEYWQHHYSETLRNIRGVQGIAVEGIVMGKSIDILIETENEKIALEIEMTPDHAIVNVEKDLKAGCSAVFTGCKDKAVLEKVNRSLEALAEEPRHKVHLCLVQNIIAGIEKYLKSQH